MPAASESGSIQGACLRSIEPPERIPSHDLIAYFAALNQFSRAMVAQWPGPTHILDATATSPPELLTPILTAFGLPVLPLADFRGTTPIGAYVGTYERTVEGPTPERLTIQLLNNQLQLDTYWPGGTVLLAMQEDLFRLESTNRWLRFERDGKGSIIGAHYQLLGQQVRYRKVTEDAAK